MRPVGYGPSSYYRLGQRFYRTYVREPWRGRKKDPLVVINALPPGTPVCGKAVTRPGTSGQVVVTPGVTGKVYTKPSYTGTIDLECH